MLLRTSHVVVPVIAIVLDGCRRESTAPDVPVVLQIAPSAAAMTAGQTVQFTAGRSASLAGAELRWTSSDSTLVTVPQAGLARALASAPGVQVCVTAITYPTLRACASIVVPAR